MALDIFNVRAIISGSVTGTDSFDRFSSKLNTIGKNADTVNKQMSGLGRAMGALASGAAAFSISNVIAEFARVTIQIDAYQKQLSMGFGAASTLELEQLRKTLRNLGIAQDEALGSAVRFTSALKLSGNSAADANKNFEAASRLILANKLSADGANRVYYAMAQVASKGKLMTEELSGQLAENLAGVREQVAIALNMSSATLMEQMKEGKVSAEMFFEALRKIGDGIDPNKLDSAAKSLGELKNAWFDFKTSILTANEIKAALDTATTAISFLTNNAGELRKVVVTLVQAFAGLTILRLTSAALTFLIPNIYLAAASIRAFGIAAFFAFEGTQVLNAGMKALGLATGPVGWAMTAAAIAFGYFYSSASKAEEASSALAKSQQSMSGVIDLSTGKIISQDKALVEHNRLLALAALETNKLAAAEAQRQAVEQLAPVASGRMGIRGDAQTGLQKAQKEFQESIKSGTPDILGYENAITKLIEKYPALQRQLGDTTVLFANLIKAQGDLETSQISFAIASGTVTEEQKKRARQLGLLFDEGTGGAIKGGGDGEAQSASRSLQYQTALVGMSERYRFAIEKLNEAKLVSFDADGTLITASGELTERIRQQAYALYDAQQAQRGSNQAKTDAKNLAQSVASQLQSMGASNAQLKDQIDNWNAIGESVGKSQLALMEYETTQGKWALASEKEKRDLIEAAALTDKYTAAIESLRESEKLADSMSGMDKDISELKFKIQYFQKYGDSIDSSREAQARFDTTEGEFRNATDEQKRAIIARGREIDVLTGKLKGLTAAAQASSILDNFMQSARNKVEDVRQRTIAIAGGSRSQVERANFAQSLNKNIEDARSQSIESGLQGAELKKFIDDLNMARDQALREFDAATKKLEQMQGDWMVGAKAGLAEYYDQIKDVAGAMQNLLVNAFTGAEDALVNFVMTGKLSFSDLARSIIQDLARIAIQQAIMAPLLAWFKGMGWIPAADGAAFSGGSALTAYATGGVVTAPTMFRHSGGLGVMGEAGPEAIMPLRRLSNGRLGVESAGGGTQNVTVNVSVESGGQIMQSDGGADAKNLGKAIANVVRQELLAQKRPGGMLAA